MNQKDIEDFLNAGYDGLYSSCNRVFSTSNAVGEEIAVNVFVHSQIRAYIKKYNITDIKEASHIFYKLAKKTRDIMVTKPENLWKCSTWNMPK